MLCSFRSNTFWLKHQIQDTNTMICPYCKHEDTKVVDSRDVPDIEETRRRRECLKCEKRFTTKEKVEGIDISITKKNGNKENFDREKVKESIKIACRKRPVSKEQIENALDRIESKIRNSRSTEVPSKYIGERVMTELKRLDKVAYIRFASVYKDFKDLEEFEEELHRLLGKPIPITN
jgi:transcriptional repressor NrdR